MKFKRIKNRDLATALKAFFITLGCFAAVFLVIAAASPKRSGNSKENGEDAPVSSVGNTSVVVLYDNGAETEFAKLEFNFKTAEYSCADVPDRRVTLGDMTMRLSEFLKARGVSAFLEAYTVFSGSDPAGYIRFTPETLRRTADRFGGLDGENGSRITGDEVTELAENGKLCDVIRKLADRFFSPFGSLSLKNRFLYLVSAADTNLSYAEFHRCREQLERFRKTADDAQSGTKSD